MQLFEREEEIERIEAALERARAGAGSVVVIEGAAGIGKTELAMTTRLRAREAGMAVSMARGSELERQFAFGVVRQLLEPTVAAADEARREELFSGAAALAKPLFTFGPYPRGEPAEGESHAATVLHGLYWLCAALAQSRPLLLLVDDAHWADVASLRFLAYLARRLEGLEVALVVAARPAESPAEEELLGYLATDPRAVTASPRPLSRDAVAALLDAALGQAPEAPFADACHTATGGTPFLVQELVRELRAEGLSPVAASARRIHDLGPRAVARSVVARARGAGALALARAVAVLGADAEPRRTAALAEIDDSVAAPALDRLAAMGLIGRGRPIEFAHPILRSAVYGGIPDRERSRLHLRAAALLADDGSREERIAAHLLATDPAGDQGTVELMVRVGGAALARGAPASAVSYLRRALAEPPSRYLRAGVLDQLAVAEIHAGQLGPAVEHLAAARPLAADARQSTRIARHLVAALSIQGRYREAAAVIDDLLEHPAQLERDLALALEGELLLLALFEPQIRSEVEGRLRRIDRRIDGRSPGARTYLAALTMDAALRLRPAAEVQELGARARAAGIVEEVGSGAIAWNQVMFPLIFADAFTLAEQMVAEAFDHLEERPSVVGSARAYLARSFVHLRRGALRDAIADARAGADAARDASFVGLPIAVSVLVDALIERGEPAAAAAALEDADMDREIPETFLHSWVVASRARLRLVTGRVEEAIAEFEQLGRRVERFNQSNPATVGYHSVHAIALLRRGDRDEAASLAQRELDLARLWGAPRATGVSLRVLGLCRAGARGIELLRESAETLDGSGARLEHARSLVELGAAIRRSGRRTEARDPLHAGMELAHRCGATPMVERAREELLATGARPRRIMRTGIDALTPSELRVARMAAQGMTNREIAEVLFVTSRTVEGHLTNAFQKLDIDSRHELGGRLGAGD